MNPTSLFTNLLSLVPRRDGEGRPPLSDEGPRFELPELSEASSRGPTRHELSPLQDRRELEPGHERDDEEEPRAELVMQRGPDELAAEGGEGEVTGEAGDAPGFDTNGRPRGTRGQGEPDPAAKAEAPGVRREPVADSTPEAETATPRASSSASAPGGSAQASGQPHAGPSSSGQAQHGQPQSGQAAGPQGQAQSPGQSQGPQAPASAVPQTQVAQNAQVVNLVQGAAQAMTPVVAQLALAQQDPEASLEVPGGLESKVSGTSEAGAATGLDALLEAGLDELGLKLGDRVLGVGTSPSLSAGAGQVPTDLSGEVADAVQRLLAEAAEESSLLRFRTESGQTFLAQARLEPGQPMELRLLSDDPGIRAMLAERLNDLRTALGRVGFGDAAVQVDRDPSHQGEHSRHPEDREAGAAPPEDLAPRTRRAAYGAPETAQHGTGRLHLIL